MKKKRAISAPSRLNSLMGLGFSPSAFEARVLGVEIGNGQRDVAVAVAERVGLGAALVDRQLELEIGLAVAQVDEREAVEIEAVGDVEAESLPVEIDGAVLVEDADHGMDRLGHRCSAL